MPDCLWTVTLSLHDNKKLSAEESEKKISLEFALTRTDLLWYNLYFSRHLMIIAGFLAVLLAGVLVLIFTSNNDDKRYALLWIAAGLLIGIVYCLGSIAIIIAQVFYSQSDAINASLAPKSYQIDESGIRIRSHEKQMFRSWPEIRKIDDTKNGYYFRTIGKTAIIIPKRELKGKACNAVMVALIEGHRRNLTVRKSIVG